MKVSLRCTALLLALLFIAAHAHAATIITFEGFADSTDLTNQYSGLTFTNAVVLKAGVSLNETEFPPQSGLDVIIDIGGPMTISFASPVTSVGAYFTYTQALSLQAFGAGNTLVSSTTSLFSQNFVSSGHSPNEFLQLNFAGGISSITITGSPVGTDFVLDDLTYDTATITSVPEPASVSLLLTGAAIAAGFCRNRVKPRTFAKLGKPLPINR